jgi:hypothetical protein
VLRRTLAACALIGAGSTGTGLAAATPMRGEQDAAAAQTRASPSLPDCVVPDLLGRTLLEIDYAKTLAGLVDGNPTHYCTLGSVTRRRPVGPAHGQPELVVSQTPRAGTRVPYFSLVTAPARPPIDPGVCHLFPGTDAVARSPALVVYRTYAATDLDGDPTLPVLKVTWRACVRRSGVRRTVFSGERTGEGFEDAGDFVIGGLFVAHTADTVESKYTGGSDSRAVVVFDLATGRQTFEGAVGSTLGPGNDPPGTPPVPGVDGLVVNAQGRVAWVSRYPTGDLLYVHDSQGTRLLAAGAVDAITELAIGTAALSWDAGGMPESAPIS